MSRAARGGRALDVSINGRAVGRWSVDAGRHRLAYAPDWIASPEARPLSLSLPLREAPHAGPAVERWFENLLPDDPAMRERMRRRFGARSSATIDLLAEVGRDCVGAVQLLEPDVAPAMPGPATGTPLDEGEVAALLRDADPGAVPGGTGGGGFRISLAGAQEKTALTRIDGRWHRPHGATPTTHILKLPLGRVAMRGVNLSTSVANEHLCMRFLAALGLDVADTAVARFEDVEALVVTRFDRRLASDGATLLRLPQEDFCQAFGLSREAKYEADGGPGIARCMALLAGSRRAGEDRRAFFTAQVVFRLLAAVDGHAKNFSLRLERGARYSLAPLYDVLSVWPYLGTPALPRQRAAFAMGWHGRNRHYRLAEIRPRHVAATAARCAMKGELPGIVERLVATVPEAIERVCVQTREDVPTGVAGPVFDAVTDTLARLVDGLS